METIKIILMSVSMGLFALSIFFNNELESHKRKGRDIPKMLSFNWPRLWLGYTILAGAFIVIFS